MKRIALLFLYKLIPRDHYLRSTHREGIKELGNVRKCQGVSPSCKLQKDILAVGITKNSQCYLEDPSWQM